MITHVVAILSIKRAEEPSPKEVSAFRNVMSFLLGLVPQIVQKEAAETFSLFWHENYWVDIASFFKSEKKGTKHNGLKLKLVSNQQQLFGLRESSPSCLWKKWGAPAKEL